MLHYLFLSAVLFITQLQAQPLFINYEPLQIVDCMELDMPGKDKHIMTGIRGDTIRDIIWLQRQIKIIVTGLNVQTKQVDKQYSYKGVTCSLVDLISEEEKLTLAFAQKEKAVIESYNAHQDEKAYQQALVDWQHEYDIEKYLLSQELNKAKAGFYNKTERFMTKIRLFKGLVCTLIDIWCEHNNRQESFLRKWVGMDANEREEFFKYMDTSAKLHVFLADLTSFLGDFVDSLPRARKDFFDNKEFYLKKK
jgi:hypothetical protein